MDQDEVIIPKKRLRAAEQKIKCIICGENAQQVELTSPKDAGSWQTLLRAAEVKNFTPIISLSVSENEVPKYIFYHRQCRSTFTLKKSIDAILKQQEEPNKMCSDDRRKSQRQFTGI